MKPRKTAILAVLVGLLLFAFAVSMAQESRQNTQAKTSESCCSMDSCCCHGGSCATEAGETKTSATEGCCGGDSCDMEKMKSMKNHATADKADCCNGESCDAAKTATGENHSGCCCCSGESCDMKNHTSTPDCCNAKEKQKENKGTKIKGTAA